MAIRPFLAMTAAEMQKCTELPQKIAWMACHFSPYGTGLSNIPPSLPERSVLVVDDITPIRGHDPEVITQQLRNCLEMWNLTGILLDFQRLENKELSELTHYLRKALPCPVAAPERYAENGPVFLPPVPPSVPLQEHLAPWKGHEIWLDISRWGEVLTLSAEGCNSEGIPSWDLPEGGFKEEKLHCHYHISLTETSAGFTLWRTEEDIQTLLNDAAASGVTHTVGLYQELGRSDR